MAFEVPKLRVSRSTNNLEKLINFYCNGLGLEILDRYEAQHGWDGVICGHRDWPYQIEFSQKRDDAEVPRAPTMNHFIVVCITDRDEWKKALGRLYDAGYRQVTNPQLYADGSTATFEDPDGYRLVVKNGFWKK